MTEVLSVSWYRRLWNLCRTFFLCAPERGKVGLTVRSTDMDNLCTSRLPPPILLPCVPHPLTHGPNLIHSDSQVISLE